MDSPNPAAMYRYKYLDVFGREVWTTNPSCIDVLETQALYPIKQLTTSEIVELTKHWARFYPHTDTYSFTTLALTQFVREVIQKAQNAL